MATAIALCNMPGYRCFAEAQMLMERRHSDVWGGCALWAAGPGDAAACPGSLSLAPAP